MATVKGGEGGIGNSIYEKVNTDRQVFGCIGQFAGPFCVHDFVSRDVHQVFFVILKGVFSGLLTDCA